MKVEWITHEARLKVHPEIDVAVISAEGNDGQGFPRLGGMVFRNPRWADDVRVFGYPEVLGLTEQPLTVEHGDVVTLDAEAPAVGGYPRHKLFLTSAIARPGNSGGPIVAQDGRVVGLVVDHTRAGLTQAGNGPGTPNPDSSPLYRGIPGGEVVRAIEELGFVGIAILEEDSDRG